MVSFFVMYYKFKSSLFTILHFIWKSLGGLFIYCFFFCEAASLKAGIRIVDCSEWKRMIAMFACRGEEFFLCDSFDSYYNVSGLALILPLFFFNLALLFQTITLMKLLGRSWLICVQMGEIYHIWIISVFLMQNNLSTQETFVSVWEYF